MHEESSGIPCVVAGTMIWLRMRKEEESIVQGSSGTDVMTWTNRRTMSPFPLCSVRPFCRRKSALFLHLLALSLFAPASSPLTLRDTVGSGMLSRRRWQDHHWWWILQSIPSTGVPACARGSVPPPSPRFTAQGERLLQSRSATTS